MNCRNFLRRAFCVNRCCKKKLEEDPVSRRESVLSKKKSLTISTASPPEVSTIKSNTIYGIFMTHFFQDNKPKLDLSLVEHASHMKGAIPVLPIRLAWFCLICNILVPGTGKFSNTKYFRPKCANLYCRRYCTQWSVLSLYWKTKIFSKRWRKTKNRCFHHRPHNWMWTIIHRTFLSCWMGMVHMVGCYNGEASQ